MTHKGGMEHRWRVPYTVRWPHLVSDYYETSAESGEEAKAKVAALLNRRCALETDWHFDGEAELVL
jgi:hypothetical protein